MTRQQAIEAMYQGRIVYHPLLEVIGARYIFIAQPSSGLRDHRGTFLHDMWDGRAGDNLWETGWEMHSDQNAPKPVKPINNILNF